MRGTLALVVGPSGAGKDTLIRGAQAALADEAHFVFPQREITRPAGDLHETHIPISEASFEARRAGGAYALTWRAHGLGYGIPREIDDSLAAGRSVIVNVSRGVIAEARARYETLAVLSIAVPPEVLRRRLAARGRESEDEVAARLSRAAAYEVQGPEVTTLVNDGPPAAMIAKFVRLLRGLGVEALSTEELSDEDLEAIASAEPPPEAASFDHEVE